MNHACVYYFIRAFIIYLLLTVSFVPGHWKHKDHSLHSQNSKMCGKVTKFCDRCFMDKAWEKACLNWQAKRTQVVQLKAGKDLRGKFYRERPI